MNSVILLSSLCWIRCGFGQVKHSLHKYSFKSMLTWVHFVINCEAILPFMLWGINPLWRLTDVRLPNGYNCCIKITIGFLCLYRATQVMGVFQGGVYWRSVGSRFCIWYYNYFYTCVILQVPSSHSTTKDIRTFMAVLHMRRFWITLMALGITSGINVVLESGIKSLTIILVNFSAHKYNLITWYLRSLFGNRNQQGIM